MSSVLGNQQVASKMINDVCDWVWIIKNQIFPIALQQIAMHDRCKYTIEMSYVLGNQQVASEMLNDVCDWVWIIKNQILPIVFILYKHTTIDTYL